MPSFTHHDASIYYEEFRPGTPPIPDTRPRGPAVCHHVWNCPSAPANPTTEFAAASG